jgi:hypothetical protein
MRANAGGAGVQEEACCALKSLIFNDAVYKIRVRNAGAVEAVVAAMRAHAGSASVQKAACVELSGCVIHAQCKYGLPSPHELFRLWVANWVAN